MSTLGDLLAILHRDGGHHTNRVGVQQSIDDAIKAYYDRLREDDDLNAQQVETICGLRDEISRRDAEIKRLREAIKEWEIADFINNASAQHDPSRRERLHKAERVLREIAREGE